MKKNTRWNAPPATTGRISNLGDHHFRRVTTLKGVLDELNLRGYVKTSGGDGIHVYLPVAEKTITYRDATLVAQALASIVAQRSEVATVERKLRKRRKGSVNVDYLQNGRGKTLAGVYSLRARPKAPVSTPLEWSELRRAIAPSSFNIKTVEAD